MELSPAVQQLLSDMEADKTTGALASVYAAALKEAVQVTDHNDSTQYVILLEGKEAENHHTIIVSVRKDDGRIEGCGIAIPTW